MDIYISMRLIIEFRRWSWKTLGFIFPRGSPFSPRRSRPPFKATACMLGTKTMWRFLIYNGIWDRDSNIIGCAFIMYIYCRAAFGKFLMRTFFFLLVSTYKYAIFFNKKYYENFLVSTMIQQLPSQVLSREWKKKKKKKNKPNSLNLFIVE